MLTQPMSGAAKTAQNFAIPSRDQPFESGVFKFLVRISAHAKVNASAAKASVIPATMMMVSVGTVKIPRVPSSGKN
jgi:hypothetical protein